MLDLVFGFNTRLGRLKFFLATLALAVVMTAICFAVATSALRNVNPANVRPDDLLKSSGMIAAMVFFALATITLYSMRFRDIGWDPVCVVPAWIALMIVDYVVAMKFPHLAMGQEHTGTVVGSIVYLVLTLALLFWPGSDRYT
ncbi:MULTISPECIES: DUF805 domain-containing protein [Bradyrhizobium]|uniref:DUF805 domain-containing protein n=1 Tax=Bradyrhizobium arachidis TaxID=858423 RepID=A0AAE7NRX0_9BRAD|nr:MULTISPECIES: DUF805 domain-containing protein [Bradyrhizobium]QOG20363.1 DUF805 domain-containing protein [Bradyrhizobium sp. SEMIA]QOZ69215.1 DUF805 domain-containing protein [Bradyrhizobium arachidis]UFW45273.1 DUF805 domain-containing protein [Bradyrhizobium arachidis]SFV11373.1 Protein of unknown function [Bradyrhizobium arachidis]